ncbi:MAG: hypothetical protein PF518_09260 [Spirochaetaceae bacterium]|nr:hypothetical protein [Spirochaetaceae bacterium]
MKTFLKKLTKMTGVILAVSLAFACSNPIQSDKIADSSRSIASMPVAMDLASSLTVFTSSDVPFAISILCDKHPNQ